MTHVVKEDVTYETASLDKITRNWSDGSTSVHYKYHETPVIFEEAGAFNGNIGAIAVAFFSIVLIVVIAITAWL